MAQPTDPEPKIPEILLILERTPNVLHTLLTGLPDPWLRADEGPQTWSPFEVVGHLLHGEDTDWIARARLILTEGEATPFTPFDRFGMTRFAQWPLEQLLDTFALRRKENLQTLRAWNLKPEQLILTGTHPSFGPVTLGQLLSTWAVHDLGHLGQIARVMAKRYDAEVGPWKEYLPVLHPRR